MAINNFKPFATAANANVTAQADWETLPALLSGFMAGKASSAQVNKAIRQASFIAAALAQYTTNKSGLDVLDDGDLNGFITKMSAAFGKDFQALDATLTALAGLATGANKLPYFTGNDTAAQTDLTSVGRDIIGKNTIADILTYLGLGASAFGLKNVVSFTTSQVVQWTVPDILKQGRKCYVVVIGGGASGAYGDATSGGTGGSAGGRSEKIVDLTGVDAVTVTVGAGGAPVTTNGTVGNAGGTSSFGTYLSATGAPTTNLFSSQLGGTGVGGDVNINGFPGAPATVGSTDGKRTGGNGGGPGGGVGRHSAAQQGAESERNAQSPGSGGAGLAYYSGLTGSTGRGADGAVYIYW